METGCFHITKIIRTFYSTKDDVERVEPLLRTKQPL